MPTPSLNGKVWNNALTVPAQAQRAFVRRRPNLRGMVEKTFSSAKAIVSRQKPSGNWPFEQELRPTLTMVISKTLPASVGVLIPSSDPSPGTVRTLDRIVVVLPSAMTSPAVVAPNVRVLSPSARKKRTPGESTICLATSTSGSGTTTAHPAQHL